MPGNYSAHLRQETFKDAVILCDVSHSGRVKERNFKLTDLQMTTLG